MAWFSRQLTLDRNIQGRQNLCIQFQVYVKRRDHRQKKKAFKKKSPLWDFSANDEFRMIYPSMQTTTTHQRRPCRIIWGFLLENTYFTEFDAANHRIIEEAYRQRKLRQSSHYITIRDSHLPAPARVYFGVAQVHLRMPGTRYYVKRRTVYLSGSKDKYAPVRSPTQNLLLPTPTISLETPTANVAAASAMNMRPDPTYYPVSTNLPWQAWSSWQLQTTPPPQQQQQYYGWAQGPVASLCDLTMWTASNDQFLVNPQVTESVSSSSSSSSGSDMTLSYLGGPVPSTSSSSSSSTTTNTTTPAMHIPWLPNDEFCEGFETFASQSSLDYNVMDPAISMSLSTQLMQR